MAKYKILAGTASYKPFIFIQDATSSMGAGLASLVYGTAGLTAYYCRDNDTAATAITLASGALGTYTSGGFIAADNTNMPGLYQIGLPNAALAAGANKVTVYLKGAANMVPVVLEIELDGINYQDSVRAGLTALPNASAGAALGLPKLDAYTNNRVSLYSLTTQGSGITSIDNGDGTTTATLAGGLAFPVGTIAKSAEITTLTTALVPTAGTIATGSAGTAIKTTLTAPSANAYKGQVIVYTSGALTGQSHLVQSSTTGANSVLTIFSSLVTSPSSGDTFSLVTGVGQKIVDMLSALGTDSKVLISTNAQTGVNFNNVGQTTNLPANVVQIAGQTASATGAVTFATGTVSTYAGGLADTNAAGILTQATNAASSAATAVTQTVGATIASAVWTAATRTISAFGFTVATTDTAAATAAYTTIPGLAAAVWAVGTRTLSAFGFTVGTTDSANVTAIKAKTDNLPASPAAIGSNMGTVASVTAAVTLPTTAPSWYAAPPATVSLSTNDEIVLTALKTMIVGNVFTGASLANTPASGGTVGGGTAGVASVVYINTISNGATSPGSLLLAQGDSNVLWKTQLLDGTTPRDLRDSSGVGMVTVKLHLAGRYVQMNLVATVTQVNSGQDSNGNNTTRGYVQYLFTALNLKYADAGLWDFRVIDSVAGETTYPVTPKSPFVIAAQLLADT